MPCHSPATKEKWTSHTLGENNYPLQVKLCRWKWHSKQYWILTDLSFTHLFHEFVRLGSVLGAGDTKMKGHNSCPHGPLMQMGKKKDQETDNYSTIWWVPACSKDCFHRGYTPPQLAAVRSSSDVSSLLLICKDLQNPLGI